ncbi:MAG: hypothetical protein IPJ97_16625 [Proteobacteria bacterium]|nr:hypothetical protein [Pseudomonadota bacterium]
MILRRVIAHFRKQEWTAIGIDLVIVVVGVFIGIQVSNWNTARTDAARADGYLERLRDDLLTDVSELEARRIYWRSVAVYGATAAAFAESGALVDGSKWKTMLAFFQASQIWRFAPSEVAFRELTGAGELGLIRNARLRAELSQYYNDIDTRRRVGVYQFIPPYRESVRGATPMPVARHIIEHCHSQGPLNQRLLDCDAPIDEETAGAILDGYLARPGLVDQLRYWVTSLELVDQSALFDSRAAQDLAEEIARELKR